MVWRTSARRKSSPPGFVHPFEFITFMRLAEGLDFDVMLEAKSKDRALLRLRAALARYAPDVAARFGIDVADALEDQEGTKGLHPC